jgi:hypothetical protein
MVRWLARRYSRTDVRGGCRGDCLGRAEDVPGVSPCLGGFPPFSDVSDFLFFFATARSQHFLARSVNTDNSRTIERSQSKRAPDPGVGSPCCLIRHVHAKSTRVPGADVVMKSRSYLSRAYQPDHFARAERTQWKGRPGAGKVTRIARFTRGIFVRDSQNSGEPIRQNPDCAARNSELQTA